MVDQDGKFIAFIRRCDSGDREACEFLLKECGRVIRGYLLRFSSYFRRQSEAIDDVTQQVFEKLSRGGLKNFRGTTDNQFRSYLKTITRNEANDFIANNWSEEDDEGETINIPNGTPGPDEKTEIREILELLEKHLQRYSLEDQQIFIMVFTKGYTYKEVGERLRLPLSVVAFRYTRITKSFEKDLKAGATDKE